MNYQQQMKLKRFLNKPLLTYAFLIIQVAVYLMMEVYGLRFGQLGGSTSISVLMKFGAMSPLSIVFQHEYWRFVTPIFVHIGLTHLLLNSVSLYFVGRILEDVLGHVRFFLVYMLSGILGNVISFGFGRNFQSVSAGASTAIFGMFVAFIVLGRIYPYNPVLRHMSSTMSMLIILNLVMNLFSSGVDILGHLGGVIGGILMTLIVSVPRVESSGVYIEDGIDIHKRILALIVFLFLIVFSIVLGFSQVGL
ncbi:rhomboid family intramembrane serine protease [Vagococcus acidifermentans]|uniref:Peptidase S54 rhomboid domain-containing protein n=1 Tax=Vagococcus acidifermentans TaxID=564710 RepID=A0A430AN73_9ENTE|nr:rhomboid family intramembrane serine protease [Vagococcus acidifermentans]RSU09539.1 hypothetical protein CBF27_12585 [Vagococcus acidifermentans]